MKKTLTILLLILQVASVTLAAAEEAKKDSNFIKLSARYNQAFNEPDQEKLFYELSQHMKEFYQERKDLNGYYIIVLNEALYDSEHGKPYDAIKKANAMMEDIKKQGINQYDKVNIALGSIYEGRGNKRMAEHYYQEALKTIAPDNKLITVDVYSRMAYVNMLTNPEKAKEWNEKCKNKSKEFPVYHQLYLYIAATINFASGNIPAFRYYYKAFQRFHNAEKIRVDEYGVVAIEMLNKAVEGAYDEAIAMIPKAVAIGDLTSVMGMDVHIKIMQMRNDINKAVYLAQERRDMIDSLNSDMLFNNLNEINAEMNTFKEKQKTAKQLERMALIIIALSFITIAVLAIWLFRRRKMRKDLLDKNEQLRLALKMAEESDRMKTEFVRQISHEIRTPLNAINGFNEILNESNMELSKEERQDLVERIRNNTQDITNIVDEMLHLSDQESSDYYAKTDDMHCNSVLSNMLYSNRDKVNPFIELTYTTKVINRFTIHTNENAVKEIVSHLVQNAIKFTTKGSINMHCQLTDDGQMVEISVTDTGRGISPEMRDKIFDKFAKEDHFKPGIGLGLTVSKKIAQKLGGDLVLDDSYTSGSRFVLTVPVE